MSSELELLVDTTRRILADADPNSEATWPTDVWRRLDDAGLTGLGVDERLGGSGGTFTDAATVVFEVGRAAAPVPITETVLAGWLGAVAEWERASGTGTVAYGSLLARADARADELALSGAVGDVAWAGEADRILVAMERDGGLIVGSLTQDDVAVEDGYNLSGEPRARTVIEEVVLPVDRWAVLPLSIGQVRGRAALLRCIAAAGAMTTIADMTVDYAASRTQFGRTIGQFQAVQQMLAALQGQVAAAVTAARAATDLVAAEGTAESLGVTAAIVRVLRAIPDVTRIAHQIHGAIGITREYPLHRWTTRLWCTRADCGGESEWSEHVLRHVGDSCGAGDLWASLTT